jgi:hypothetical protein
MNDLLTIKSFNPILKTLILLFIKKMDYFKLIIIYLYLHIYSKF